MKTEKFEHTFVCFLDILGFKDLVENNKPKELEKIYKILLQKSVDVTTKFWINGEMKTMTAGAELNSLVISDSIVIWTSNPSPIAFLKMLVSVHGIMFATMNSGIPLRGAISAGQLTVLKSENNTTVFGKGLINAYKLESQQNWSGCIVDNELIEAYRYMTSDGKKTKKKSDKSLSIEDIYFLLEYPAPMKSGTIEERWVIDWTKLMNITEENDEEEKYEGIYIQDKGVIDSFGWHNKNTNDWRIQAIIRNTLDFWAYAMDYEDAEMTEFENPEDFKKFMNSKKK